MHEFIVVVAAVVLCTAHDRATGFLYLVMAIAMISSEGLVET